MNLQVVIIGKNYGTALGVIESVGEAGYRCGLVSCVGVLPKLPTPDVQSKYVEKYVYAITRNDEDIINKIIDNFASDQQKVLIPTDDYSASLIDRYYEKLEKFFVFPSVAGSYGKVSKLMDKEEQKRLAKDVGINVPQVWPVDLNQEVMIPSDIIYPCLIKPRESFSTPGSKKVISRCDNAEELMLRLKSAKGKGVKKLLIEEFIAFDEEYTIPGVSVGEDVIIPAYIKKIKIARGSHKGVTVIGQVRSIDDEVLATLKAFIKNTGFTGIFDIEVFKKDDAIVFNELNLRSSAAGYATTAAGINLPAIFVDYLCGTPWKERIASLQEGLTFLNDKVELQEYLEGNCTWKEFKKEMQTVDICLISAERDASSRQAFGKIVQYTRLRKMKHKILRR